MKRFKNFLNEATTSDATDAEKGICFAYNH